MSREEYTVKDRLSQILESIDVITDRCKNINDCNEFFLSPDKMMLFDSVVMRLQVIGELVGKLLKEESQPLAKHPEIPWVQIYDMRNLISHEYANIDEAVVFSAIKEDLPQLRSVIEELLKY